jgi:hypothetical protein
VAEPRTKASSGAPEQARLRFLKRRSYPLRGSDDPVPDATLTDLESVRFLEHAQFNYAFDGVNLKNGAGFDKSFIDGDLNAFYVELSDPTRMSADYLEVEWFTGEQPTGDLKDVDPGPSKLILFKAEPGRFLSRPLILVNCHDDCDDTAVQPDGGLPAGHPQHAKFGGPRTRTTPNYRIRRVGMHHFVHVVYRDAAGRQVARADAPMYERTFHFDVQVYVLRGKRGGAPLARPDEMLPALELALQCYERVGYWMATTIHPDNAKTDGAEVVRVEKGVAFQYLVIQPPSSGLFDPRNVTTKGALELARAYPAMNKHTLRIFVIGSILDGEMGIDKTEKLYGVSWSASERQMVRAGVLKPDVDANEFAPPDLDETSWVESSPKNPKDALVWAFAHELGHHLMDKEAFLLNSYSKALGGTRSTFSFAHFEQPSIIRGAGLYASKNLMSGYGAPGGIAGAKRLWLQPDADGFSQVDAIRKWPGPSSP